MSTYDDLVEFARRGRAAQDAVDEAMRAHCSHTWIDPNDAPIERRPYSPVLGDGRYEMKRGAVYVCRNCRAELRP